VYRNNGVCMGSVYRHALPYALAPRVQTQVPMMFWASAPVSASISSACDENRTTASPTTNYSILFSICCRPRSKRDDRNWTFCMIVGR
jgi:glucan phosphoethanolaminetransferase (alkaline phosphatase superfamily)